MDQRVPEFRVDCEKHLNNRSPLMFVPTLLIFKLCSFDTEGTKHCDMKNLREVML